MDLGKRYIFSTGFLCVLNITLLAGLLSNGARDVESSRRLIAPSETQKATISAVDQNLLQQDHLNTWRDLRTIDEVVRHNRVASVYSQRMQEWGPKLLKLNSPSQTLITQMDASAWAETKPHRALAMVMYYFIETMKSHSPQNDHKEIESLAVGIEDSSKFKYYYNSVVARQMVNKFMYEYMLKFSWYLLIKQYSKGFKADHKGALQSSIEQAIRVWKEKNPQPLQVEYTRHYRQYMRLIEILDPLAAAGIQNSDVIRKVDIRSISLRNARTFLSKYSTDPNKVHKNLVSISPSDTFRAIKFPLFGYPLDINGKESAAIEATVLDMWKSRGQNDVNFASELIEISRSLPTARFPKGGDVFPQRQSSTSQILKNNRYYGK
ncbi:uncharacterized protein MELLADRAFT_66203 [Melampsora larici-populina 98AG31]|uniref:Uncharacterized protein n=1 Tax=Melampsora larici-populina (strain 98AG31 / pathotype 3-4-7) TaxID=747676 RepID=F4RY88_MELLP|nr:uncharacterized protein MELLADRAFT_66203 [Melampsora larici-populina 98AG31]EGG02635.1 hypothetical protein MELLADRAFT_66203 [Melampsora larici-populina 98AG31]